MTDVFAQINGMPLPRAAVEYGRMGWRIFPLWPVGEGQDGKKPLVKWKEEATNDDDQIRAWWRRWPNANIGLVTGESVWVLDVDKKRDGLINIGLLESQHSETLTEMTLRQRTGGGGFHLLWTMPQGRGVRSTSDDAALLPGLDTRGGGGYIVLSPSTHSSGRKYQWEHITLPVPAPEWLLELVMAPTAEEVKARGYVPSGNVWRGGDILDGRRTNVLFSTACSQLALAVPEAQIRENIHALNHQYCRPRLDEEYVNNNILKGALDKEPGFVRTELGVASWIADTQLRGTWCYAHTAGGRRDSGQWYRYSGTHWRMASVWEIESLIVAAIASLRRRAQFHEDADLEKFAKSFERQRTIEAIERALRNCLQEDFGRFNSSHNRHLVALANQTTLVFGRAGEWEIRPSHHDDWIGSVLPIGYQKGATCPTWDLVLGKWLGDEARIGAIWRWMAAVLSATRIDKLLLAVGPPRSGKTTFANTLRHMLGNDLACVLSTGLILRGRGLNAMGQAQKENTKSLLYGKRLGIFGESAPAVALDTEMVKALAGGDTVTAKILFKDPISFEPTHQLMLHTNNYPDDKGVDAALVERFAIFEWGDTIPETERDPDLEDKLWAERSGALNRILVAYNELRQIDPVTTRPRGLALPAKVKAANEPYLAQANTVAMWAGVELLSEEERNPTDHERNTAMYNRYKKWCQEEQLTYVGKMDFYAKIDTMGFRKGGKDGYTVYWGARMRPTETQRIGDIIIGRN